MSVRTELVREHLVAAIVAEAEGRFPGAPPEGLADVMERALELIAGRERAQRAPAESRRLAAALCRLGYLTRAVEVERFEPARADMPWLTKRLKQAGADVSFTKAAVEVSVALAMEESEERPDPGGGSASWRVPGPGGHVRHYAAIEAISRRAPRDAGVKRLGQGIYSVAELKRIWVFGFFLRCCEECAPLASG
jgi:hypothetical protein